MNINNKCDIFFIYKATVILYAVILGKALR